MATTILKGIVKEVGTVSQVGENKTDLQNVLLFVPGYHDGFSQVGRDNLFCLQVMGKKVKELNMKDKDLKDKKVIVKCYIDSQFVEPKEAGQKGFFSVNVTVNSFEVVTD